MSARGPRLWQFMVLFLLGSSSILPTSFSYSSRFWQKVFPSSSSYNFPSKSVLVRRCLTSIFLNRNSTSRFTRPQRKKNRPAIRENLHLTRSVFLVDRVYKQSCEVSCWAWYLPHWLLSEVPQVRALPMQCTVLPISSPRCREQSRVENC